MDIKYKTRIERVEADIWTKAHFVVWTTAVGAGVDRPDMHGIGVNTKALAERLAKAIEAGAVFYNPTVLTDVNGKTFLSVSSRVLARMANADLRRLGY